MNLLESIPEKGMSGTIARKPTQRVLSLFDRDQGIESNRIVQLFSAREPCVRACAYTRTRTAMNRPRVLILQLIRPMNLSDFVGRVCVSTVTIYQRTINTPQHYNKQTIYPSCSSSSSCDNSHGRRQRHTRIQSLQSVSDEERTPSIDGTERINTNNLRIQCIIFCRSTYGNLRNRNVRIKHARQDPSNLGARDPPG